jgi:hypothetical protein
MIVSVECSVVHGAEALAEARREGVHVKMFV